MIEDSERAFEVLDPYGAGQGTGGGRSSAINQTPPRSDAIDEDIQFQQTIQRDSIQRDSRTAQAVFVGRPRAGEAVDMEQRKGIGIDMGAVGICSTRN